MFIAKTKKRVFLINLFYFNSKCKLPFARVVALAGGTSVGVGLEAVLAHLGALLQVTAIRRERSRLWREIAIDLGRWAHTAR